MNKELDNNMLQRAARRASCRPFFVANALVVYQSLRQLEDDELAEYLGCLPTDLPKLALCRLPETTAPDFRAEVERIASYIGVNSLHLARLLREAASTIALRNVPQHPDSVTSQNILMAARDRSEEKQPGDKERPEAPRNHNAKLPEP